MPVKTEEEFVEESTTHMTNGGGKTLASAETNTAGSGHRKSKVGNSRGVVIVCIEMITELFPANDFSKETTNQL